VLLECGPCAEREGDAIRTRRLSAEVTKAIECDGVLSTLPLPARRSHRSAAAPGVPTIRGSPYRSLSYLIALKAQAADRLHWVYLLDEHFRVTDV